MHSANSVGVDTRCIKSLAEWLPECLGDLVALVQCNALLCLVRLLFGRISSRTGVLYVYRLRLMVFMTRIRSLYHTTSFSAVVWYRQDINRRRNGHRTWYYTLVLVGHACTICDIALSVILLCINSHVPNHSRRVLYRYVRWWCFVPMLGSWTF
jgi:hypothetical protein